MEVILLNEEARKRIQSLIGTVLSSIIMALLILYVPSKIISSEVFSMAVI